MIIFVPLKYNVVKKTYDDMINYNNVSPLDIFYCFVDKFYLAIKADIKIYKENYEKYKKYIKEIKDLKNKNIFIKSDKII